MNFFFERRNNTYRLINIQDFATKRKRTAKMGLESLNYRYPQLWSILSENLGQISSLVHFKDSVSKWDCTDCPYILYKLYLLNIGFL